MIGRPEAGDPLRRGAGGDITVRIDDRAEQVILERLKKAADAGARFTLISEECGIRDFGSDRLRLLVDPVDGSNNAKRGVPYCAASLALLRGDRIGDLWVGSVIDLISGKDYTAIRGEGAWVRDGDRIVPLRTRGGEEIGMVAFEASTPKADLEKILPLLTAGSKVRCLGAIALDLALLAAGAVDVVAMAAPSRSVDFAAGVLLLREAGGVITDFEGDTLDGISGGLERTRPLLASANEKIHRKALERLRKVR